MTPEQFCYWLQGCAELQPDVPLSDAEWKSVREHLATVFKKVTPQVLGPNIASPALPPSFPYSPGTGILPVVTC